MFSKKNKKSFRKIRSRKRQLSNHFTIESLEAREMMAADLAQERPMPRVQFLATQPAAVSTSTPGGPTSTGPISGSANSTSGNANVGDLPMAGDFQYTSPTLGATFANGVLTVTGSNANDNIEIYRKNGMLYVREVVKNQIIFSMPHSDPITTFENARAFTNPLEPQLKSIVVNANAGNDWIKIEESLNVPVTMRGGLGDDTLMGGNGADYLYGGAGNDKLLGHGGNDYLYGEQGNDLIIGGDGNDRIYGGDGDDNLVGGNGDDWLEGGNGNDQMFGEAGNDVLLGGPGQNLMDGGAGNDILYGGEDIDAIYGGDGDDVIRGFGGDDRLRGEGGNDDIEGGDGDDAIEAGEGNDYVLGGVGNDVIGAGGGNDTVYGGADQDWINGKSGNDFLYGDAGNDYIVGEDGTDTTIGGSGNNLVYTNDPPGLQYSQVQQALGWSDVTDFVGDILDTLVGVFNWTLDKAQSIGERFLDWAANIDDRLFRLAQDLAGALSNWPWEAEFWTGLGRSVIDVLEVAGIAEAWEAAFELLKPWQRGMTPPEVEVARSVFGDAIDYDRVRMDEHSLGAYLGRTHVTGYIINSNENISDRTMIHELTHVWQYANDGLVYIPEALDAQGGAGYDYGGVAGLTAAKNAGRTLLYFNREQQGAILADYYDKIQEARGFEATVGYAPSWLRQDLDVYVHFVKSCSTLSVAQLDAKDPPPIQFPVVGDLPVKQTSKITVMPSSSPVTTGGSTNSTTVLDAAYTHYSPQPSSTAFRSIAQDELAKTVETFKPVTTGDLDRAFALLG